MRKNTHKKKLKRNSTNKKQYIEFSGTVYNGYGWSQEKYDEFVDKVVEVAESFGGHIQMAAVYGRKTEEEL